MAKPRQDREIKKFRDGDCNVIVATSVLLEGIDVPKCNFAINYGMPGNEITFMQARGRVRSRETDDDWQYEIIVSREQVMAKERDCEKEKLMKKALLEVMNKNEADFKREVHEIQENCHKEYMKRLVKDNETSAITVPDEVEFYCKKCDVFACKAKHIKIFGESSRIVPHYKKNLPYVRFEEASDAQRMGGGIIKTGNACCSECSHDWGVRGKNKYGEFPLLKISGFRVKAGDSSDSVVYKKWKDFPYELEKFDAKKDC